MCAICNFKIDFGVSHPLSLAVAVATRAAMDRGELTQQDMAGPLATARLKLASIDTLAQFQSAIEASFSVDALMQLPDFYVLLIEADTWGFFHATADGFDPDVIPEPPNLTSPDPQARSVVIVTSEVALREVLQGAIALRVALDAGLIAFDAPDDHVACVHLLMNALPSKTLIGRLTPEPISVRSLRN